MDDAIPNKSARADEDYRCFNLLAALKQFPRRVWSYASSSLTHQFLTCNLDDSMTPKARE